MTHRKCDGPVDAEGGPDRAADHVAEAFCGVDVGV
jgi:hypothetical protein